MISLSDDELKIIVDSAKPLAPPDRSEFLRTVALELGKYQEIGAGLVGRICAKTQREYLAPRLAQ